MKIKLIAFLFIFFVALLNKAIAQEENNIWYFGDTAGIDFNGGTPVALSNSGMRSNWGSCSVSDEFGNILFYTNGNTVYNSNHVPMPNGSGLGTSYLSQWTFPIKKPGNSSIYYIFYIDIVDQNDLASHQLLFSEIDMSLNGGLGDITASKNILLADSVARTLTGVKNRNCTDFWIVSHRALSGEFLSFAITSSGINSTPVVSAAGPPHDYTSGYDITVLKASPAGNMLAMGSVINGNAYFSAPFFISMDHFDNSTGVATTGYVIFDSAQVDGLTFSPDGTKLYSSPHLYNATIFQFDLTLGSQGAIQNSLTPIFRNNDPANNWIAGFMDMQIGPDQKVYISPFYKPYLCCVNNPNIAGGNCNFVYNALSLSSGTTTAVDLPHFIQTFAPTFVVPNDTIVCGGSSVPETNFNGAYEESLFSWTCSSSAIGIAASGIGNIPAFECVNTTSNPITATITVALTYPCIPVVTKTYLITVNPAPAVDFSTISACSGAGSVQFTDSSTGGLMWNWDFGDGETSLVPNPTHTYATCDVFNARLIVTNNIGCVDSITKAVTVSCQPTVDFDFTDICLGQSASFIDQSDISNGSITAWSWDFGDASPIESIQSPTHSYSNAGTFPVTLIVSGTGGCADTLTQNITIHPLPQAEFSVEKACENTFTQFIDSSTITGTDILQYWSWNFSDGSPSSNNSSGVLHLYPSIGVYPVKLILISNFGCVDSLTKMVSINPQPTVNFSANDTVGCSPLCISLQGAANVSGGNIASYVWNFGDGSPEGQSPDIEHCYQNTTNALKTYDVSLTAISDSGCAATFSKNAYISVTQSPVANFSISPNPASILESVISFTNTSSGATAWNWDFGDQTTSLSADPEPHSYNDTGSFIITLIVSNSSPCYDTTSLELIVEPDWSLFIPNAFTPNGDGVNDVFQGYGNGILFYEMSIFDRWGNNVFYTKTFNEPWKGKTKNGNEDALSDVYVYSVNIKDVKGKNHYFRGIVTLQR